MRSVFSEGVPRVKVTTLTSRSDRKDDDKKDKPDRKKKVPRQQAAKPAQPDEGWTTVSATDKVAKVSTKLVGYV